MSSFPRDLKEGMSAIARVAVGWEDVLVQAMFALATREHVFWLSGPGRAKSWVARMIFSLFPDARSFMIQVTKDMLPSSLFGNEIPDEYLKTGREIFNLDGGICTAHLVYLDEFLDGPDFLVRSINTVLNERMFERKDQRVRVPLHSGIMTTNFDRYGHALEAVRDRMMCKAVIARPATLVDRIRMYDAYLSYAGSMPVLPKLCYEELVAFADTVEAPEKVTVPAGVRLVHALLIRSYEERRNAKLGEGEEANRQEVTPRTEARLHDFSRAAALLDGRTAVDYADLHALRYGLVTIGGDPAGEETFEEVTTELLPTSSGQKRRLEKLAAIAKKVGELKTLGDSIGEIAIEAAGEMETFTKVSILEFLDKLAGESRAVKLIAGELKNEILVLQPTHRRYTLR